MSEAEKTSKREMPGLVLLWNYPEIWWRRRSFFGRVVLIAIVVGLISAVAIASYDSRVRAEQERLLTIQSKAIEELSRLTSEVKSEREEAKASSESEVLKEIEKVKDELRELQYNPGSSETGLLNTSVEEALAALELAYPSTSSGSR